MFGQARAQQRSIPGAVATVGVNDRVAFLRKTYGHLAAAIFAFVGVAYLFVNSELGARFTIWAFSGRWNWLMVLGAFMVVGFITDKLARSDTSPGLQYLGLGLGVVAEAIIITPLLFVAAFYSKDPYIIHKAGVLTLTIFAGLTATVFITKKDFSFLRGILMVGSFAALGLIIASMAFGFHLGTIFAVAMIVLMAGYILYQTSLLMAYFRPTQHVAASLMLFSTIATLFWYVLQLLMSLQRN
ncbi:MAG TPA: Bax inhibitor-1 family protein [Kofleriaceae bacterium]|nr:Bax inhibitor-1 family protein [Kofleriaceae bacterium]